MLKQYTLTTIFLFCVGSIIAQNTVEDYVNRFNKTAIEQMQRTGIPASILLAHGIFESSFGNSQLAIQANNHFRLTCNDGWDGEFFLSVAERKKNAKPVML